MKMSSEELLKLEREKVEQMLDAVSKIHQYMRHDDIYTDKESHDRMLKHAMLLRSVSHSFVHTERIIRIDNDWDDIQ